MLDSASAEPGVIGQSPGTSAVDFDFSLGAAATPEPASLVLLSTGLLVRPSAVVAAAGLASGV